MRRCSTSLRIWSISSTRRPVPSRTSSSLPKTCPPVWGSCCSSARSPRFRQVPWSWVSLRWAGADAGKRALADGFDPSRPRRSRAVLRAHLSLAKRGWVRNTSSRPLSNASPARSSDMGPAGKALRITRHLGQKMQINALWTKRLKLTQWRGRTGPPASRRSGAPLPLDPTSGEP